MEDLSYKIDFLSNAWHLAYYIPKSTDLFTENIICFKNNNPPIVRKWIDWAVDEFTKIDINFDYIVRVLGSKELIASKNRSLDLLGQKLAEVKNAQYVPEVLIKSKKTTALHFLNKQERELEILNIYNISQTVLDFNNKNILILDDVSTSQTTIREVHRALIQKWPNGNYYFFCLGQTSHDDDANDQISQKYLNT